MIGAVPARTRESGMLVLLREAALPLALFSGVVHFGVAVVVGLMVLGVVSGGFGGTMVFVWSVFSLLLSLAGYRRMEERRRRRAGSALAVAGMQALASRVIALYPRPVEDPAIAQVFDLYRRAQVSLEEGDHRSAGEAAERGIELADRVLEGGRELPSSEEGEAEGGVSWK